MLFLAGRGAANTSPCRIAIQIRHTCAAYAEAYVHIEMRVNISISNRRAVHIGRFTTGRAILRNVSLELRNASLDLRNVSVDLRNVSVDLRTVSVDLRTVSSTGRAVRPLWAAHQSDAQW